MNNNVIKYLYLKPLALCALILLIHSFNIVHAQNIQRCYYGQSYTHKVIDTCKYAIIYDYRYYKDTARTEEYYDIKGLEIGNRITRYHSLLAEKMDSLGKIIKGRYSYKKRLDLNNNQKAVWEDTYFNYPHSGTLMLTALIYRYEYCYQEDIPKMKWEITEQTDTILGYKCYCATTFFRGRTYIAWFTPQIPLHYGPYKFNGLPGLILKIQDSQKLFTWTANRIYMPINKKIYFDQGRILKKIKRKGYSKILKMVWDDRVLLFLSQQNKIYRGSNSGRAVLLKPGDLRYPPIPAIELE
ncbi:MAG: GLPGLI family protein [Bacteroidales bacterium]|jgi:GLPGLI family protein|nr:GLPGLI family protein [Bacteroidales bacterium]